MIMVMAILMNLKVAQGMPLTLQWITTPRAKKAPALSMSNHFQVLFQGKKFTFIPGECLVIFILFCNAFYALLGIQEIPGGLVLALLECILLSLVLIGLKLLLPSKGKKLDSVSVLSVGLKKAPR